MPLSTSRFGYFRRAIVDFLITNSTLVTATGHTAGAPRIMAATAEDVVPSNCLLVFCRPSRPFIPIEIDGEPWHTSIHIYMQNTSEETLQTMIGALQDHTKRSATPPYRDVSYTTHANINIESIRWSPDLSNAPEIQKNDKGFFWTDTFLVARWREKE